MRTDRQGRVRLGSFELNLETGELTSFDPELPFRKVYLPEKPFLVLRRLVELRGELGSRDEIQKLLWPNDTIVDFDHNINVAIAALRRAFGDSANHPKYIETVPRRGYRLVVPAEWVEADDRESEERSKDPSAPNGLVTRAAGSALIGRRVSHFRVIEVIGGGGMGMVYRAEDLELGRQVALKFLPEEMAADPISLKRFKREAQTASSLNHLNICTIFEVAEYEGQPFIVMELLDGQTLRDCLVASESGTMPLDELLAIALQTCDGLQAAHARGIIHRDIKPGNIFLTKGGASKILDFGLAKLVEAEEAQERNEQDSVDATASYASVRTSTTWDAELSRTGVTMGTTSYMSPEQLLRKKLDARTDLFSFGLVLYEMATGQRALAGDTALEVHQTLLYEGLAPVRSLNPAVPPMLEAVIAKALQRQPEDRYHSAAEMRAALASVPSPRKMQLLRIRNWLALTVLILFVMTAAFTYWRYQHRFQLTAGETIVIADISNQTGDPVLDDALNLALPVELAQTPFLQVLGQDKVRETMSQLHYPKEGKVTPEIAREVCQRTNSKAVVTTVIADAGNSFHIRLTGVNCQTGKIFAHAEQNAALRNEIVHALGVAGAQLRSRMGEPQDSVRKYSKPLDLATSPAPEALQLIAKGFKKQLSMDMPATIPLYERAIDVDPSFALAYASVGISYLGAGKSTQALDAEKKAYELRDRLTGQTRFLVETLHYDVGLGDLQKSVPIYEEWIRTFPLDGVGHHNFSTCLLSLGQYDRAAHEAREAVRLMPLLRDGSYSPLMRSAAYAGRLEEAKLIFAEAESRKLDDEDMHELRHLVAFLEHNDFVMGQQVTWLKDHSQGGLAAWRESAVDAYYGRFRDARRLLQGYKTPGTNFGEVQFPLAPVELALQEAEAGDTASAARLLNDSPQLPDNRERPRALAMILARTGNIEPAKKLTEEIDRESPQDTLVQYYLLPTIRAAIELRENKPASAIDFLRPAEKYELASPISFDSVYPAYIRGLAYLQLGNGKLAAGEFKKLLDHPALVGRWVTGALAYLQLGRAQAMMGDDAAARKSYQTFLGIWKNADPQLATLARAKAELAALR